MAISSDNIEDIVKPELFGEFESVKRQWLAWDKWSNREPVLFKLEFEGTRGVALAPKCYFFEDEDAAHSKRSSKGVSHRQNPLSFDTYSKHRLPNEGWGYGNVRSKEGRFDSLL